MGNLDIESLERIDDFNPDKPTTKVLHFIRNIPLKMKEPLTS